MFKQTRYVLLRNPENLSETQTAQLKDIRRYRRGIWRAYRLKEALRSIYADHTFSFDEVTNAWFYAITNSRNEGTHSAIRRFFARAFGFHTADAALSAINLCCRPTPIPDPDLVHVRAA